jgi:hypothetical protein
MNSKSGVVCLPRKVRRYQWPGPIGIDIRLVHLELEDISAHRQA